MQSTSTSAWIARIDADSWARLNAPATAATGAVTGRPHTDDPQVAAGYDWMRLQMARRLPSYRGEYPMWAWARIPRTALIDILDDATGVLVTHAAHHDRMLLSDEALYMDVLNGTRTLPDDLADDNAAAFAGQ